MACALRHREAGRVEAGSGWRGGGAGVRERCASATPRRRARCAPSCCWCSSPKRWPPPVTTAAGPARCGPLRGRSGRVAPRCPGAARSRDDARGGECAAGARALPRGAPAAARRRAGRSRLHRRRPRAVPAVRRHRLADGHPRGGPARARRHLERERPRRPAHHGVRRDRPLHARVRVRPPRHEPGPRTGSAAARRSSSRARPPTPPTTCRA